MNIIRYQDFADLQVDLKTFNPGTGSSELPRGAATLEVAFASS